MERSPSALRARGGHHLSLASQVAGAPPALAVETFAGSATEWDAFVDGCADATHCHRYGWRGVLERVFGHECIYLAARGGAGRLHGVLPLVRVRSPLFGHFLVSMPFLNYGGPIGDPAAVEALVVAAASRAASDRVSLLELRNRAPIAIEPASPAWHRSARKITVVLDIPPDGPSTRPPGKGRKRTGGGAAPGAGDSAGADRGPASALWTRIDAKVRSQVRRPQKEGVTVRFGADQLGAFYRVFARHMRDLGTPAQSRRLFEAIAAAFPEDVWFGCAYLGDQPVAAGCGFLWRDEFEMTWASALSAHKRLAPNMLLYWSFMERAAERGVRAFNFGRCTPGGGTHRFKQQWGSRDEPLAWYDWSPGAGPAKTPSPDDSAYAWGPRIWKHLPVPLATALGPRIVKYIP